MKHWNTHILMIIPVILVGNCLLALSEIPCGIYDDAARFSELGEHISAIETSMKMIHKLSKEEHLNYNQIVRWVMNKENHAEEIQMIATRYFLTQRIPLPEKYDQAATKIYRDQLSLIHELVFWAMKSKQTADLQYVPKLRKSLEKFRRSYFEH